MYSYGPPHIAEQKQDNQHEHTFSNYVRIRDVVQKTCQRRWTIGKSGERGSGISVLPARHDDDDDDIYIYIYIYKVPSICFLTFFRMAILLIVHTWNSSPLRSYLLQLQCTCCTVPTTSGRPHGSPLVWACQWPLTRSLSSPHLSHNDSLLWAKGITNCHREQDLEYREGDELSWCHLGQIVCDKDWCVVLVEMPLTRFEEWWPLPMEPLPELP